MEDWHIVERSLGADLVARFKESWALEEFLKEHGPKMQIGYYPVVNEGSIVFRRCRYGDTNKGWIYSYVSLRIIEFTPEWIVKNKSLLRVGKTGLEDYVLYFNCQQDDWVDVNFPEEPKVEEQPENIFKKLKVYGKKSGSNSNIADNNEGRTTLKQECPTDEEFIKKLAALGTYREEPWTPAYFNRRAREQMGDAFDGESDGYWNID